MPLSVLRLLCLALMIAAPFGAFAQQGSKFDQICAGQSLPVDPGELPVNPGLFWNQQRGGTGWSVLFSEHQGALRPHLVWYTYRPDGSPVWYLSDAIESVGQPDPSGPSFSTTLYSYSWDPNLGAGFRSKKGDPFAHVNGYFSSEDQSRLALEWQREGAGSAPLVPECLIDFSREFHPAGLSALAPEANRSGGTPDLRGVNMAFNGAYFDPANAGWGLMQHVIRSNGLDDASLYRESMVLTLYDAQGRSIWLLGVADGPGTRTAPEVGAKATLPLSINVVSAGFQPETPCPNGSCGHVAHGAGQWERTFIDTDTVDGEMQLSNAAGLIFEDFNYRTPVPDGQQPSDTVRLKRLTQNNYIVVDRAPCVAYPGQSTCNVSVNWSAAPAAQGVCVRRVETGAGASSNSNCIYTDHHGEFDIALDPLVYGQNGPRTLAFRLDWDGGLGVQTPNLYAKASTSEDPLASMNDASYPSAEAQAPHTPGLTRLPGAAGVSGGAATYTVPIEVPPGRRGMQPSVSLEYSSRAGNGIAGMGFSLSAGGSIHRCPQTLEQDGVVRAVRLDASDKLCLDGQRLNRVEGGAYGASGAVYATEINSFVRVRQLGGDLSSAATYFEVRTKDGEVRTYGTIGSAAGAVVRPRGSSGELAPLSWMLAERRDTLGTNAGNTERYVYGTAFPESSEPGAAQIPEVLLTEIKYTGYRSNTSHTDGDRSVRFIYEPRPDRSSSFIGGGVLWQAQRLKALETYAPNAAATTTELVRRYTLEYRDYSGAASSAAKAPVEPPSILPFHPDTSQSSGRSLLRSITEEARDGSITVSRAPTQFNWQDGDLEAQERSTSQLVAGAGGSSGLINGLAPVRVVGDFNGDGHRDLLARGANGESILLTLGASRQVVEAIDVTAALGGTGIDDGRIASQWFVDVDLDARQDLLGYEPEAIRPVDQSWELVIYRSEPGVNPGGGFDGFFPAKRRIRTGIIGDRSLVVGAQRMVDFNGDGYPDILWQREAVAGCKWGAFTLLQNLRDGSFQSPTSGASMCLDQAHGQSMLGRQLLVGTEDVNGDGVVDVILGTSHGSEDGWESRGTWNVVRFGSVDNGGVYTFGSQQPIAVIFPGEGATPSLEDLWGHRAAPLVPAPLLFQRGDFNGDGLLDLVWAAKRTSNSQTLEWVFRLNTGAGFGPKIWSGRSDGLLSRGPTPESRAPINGSLIRVTDTNADGRDELVIPTGFAQLLCQRFVDNSGGFQKQGARKTVEIAPISGLSCALNEGAPAPNALLHPDARPQACDVGRGREVSTSSPEEVYACPEHPETGALSFVTEPGMAGTFARFQDIPGIDGNGLEKVAPMYARGYGGHNSSTYTYSAIDLDFRSATSGILVRFSEKRRLPQAFVPEEDLFSDGLADGLGASGCLYRDPESCARLKGDYIAQGSTPSVSVHDHPPYERRFHYSESLGVGYRGAFSLGAPLLPDLLSSVAEPVAGAYGGANIFEWRYSPLSGLADRGAGDLPLYSLQPPAGDAASYADERHFYFTSSMPVVAEFSRPAGVRNTQGQPLQNTTLYGYGQAMYHVFGRGFQGFRSIHEWDLAQGTALETVFHQRFPLTSRIERQTLSVLHVDGSDAALGKPLSKTLNTWACGLTNRGACPANGQGWGGGFPFLDKEVVETFDAALAEAGTQAPAISRRTVTYANWSGLTDNTCPAGSAAAAGYDDYGNLLYKFEVLEDLGSDAKLAKACSMEQHEYLAADATPAVWWVNRLQQSTQQRRVQYSTQHAPPTDAGVADAHVNPLESRRSVFAWNTTTRLLEQQTEQLIGTSTEVLTSSNFFYPTTSAINCAGAPVTAGTNYGLPNCVRVTRGSGISGIGDTAGLSLAAASPESRETATAYSGDGYFPTAVRNALGHTVSTVTRPRDGQPSEATDANGLKTRMEYDAFGFLQRTRYPQLSGSLSRQPDVAVGLQACGSAGVNCAGIADAYYRQQTSALGAPTRMQYFDALGREVASEVEAATTDMVAAGNPRFVRSGVFHNRRGLVTRQAAPFAISGFGVAAPGWPNAYTEFSDFDVLGRARMKREQGMGRVGIADPDSTVPGEQEVAADRVTEYRFSGRVTSISAYALRGTTRSGERSLSREVDGLGRHLRTTDASDPDNSAGSGGTTTYWFDAWGQPVAIKDARGAVTRAVHDAAGRRHATHDPNQGSSTYLYSGFGELLRQVDARGVKQDFFYDALGRQIRREVPATSQGCVLSAPATLRTAAEFGTDCQSTLVDHFFFDGVIDRDGTPGTGAAKGLPSGHERRITSGSTTHSERRVWDSFDDYGRVIARKTQQSLRTPANFVQYGGERQYTHRYKYDSRYGRLLGEAWPNGVGRGFIYSSIGAVQAETGHGDGMPAVLREVSQVNVLGQATEEWLGDRGIGAALRIQRTQTLATGELVSIDYARSASGTAGSNPASVWQENYRYDAFGNLVQRALHQWGGGNHSWYDAYHYDLLHRMTQSTLRPFIDGVGQPSTTVALAYDVVGNLLKKSDFSVNQPNAYAYPAGTASQPNAVSSVNLAGNDRRDYAYDASGNLICEHKSSNGFNCFSNGFFDAYYNHNQQPVEQRRQWQEWRGSGYVTLRSRSGFSYGADQQPARQWGDEVGSNCGTATTPDCLPFHRIYLDRYEDTVGTYRHFDRSAYIYRTRAYVGDYLVATRGRYGQLELNFLMRDRLGSVVGVERAQLSGRRIEAMVPETRHGFDAYGAPRANRKWSGTAWENEGAWALPTRTQQGFTGHERLTGLQLIHMKGRVFDPRLGRFHGVDPVIQFPLSSQGLNPYSYILNNPMAGTDPTGYAAQCRGIPDEGEICEAVIPKENRERKGDARSDFLASETVTVASSGGLVFVTPGSGAAANAAILQQINDLHGVSDRASGPSMSGPPMGIRETCSALLHFCTASLYDSSAPSALGTYIGDAYSSFVTPSGRLAYNPLTERLVENRQAHLTLIFDVAGLFVGGGTSRSVRTMKYAFGGRVPFGFATMREFRHFGSRIVTGLEQLGHSDARVLLQGSAVTGRSFRTGIIFDGGRTSDLDVAIASRSLLDRARHLGVELRTSGTRTGPLNASQIEQLGMTELQRSLTDSVGRPVNFMIYGDEVSAAARAPSILVR